MLTKTQIKQITQLKQKKFREQQQLFVAEGIKTITELLDSHYKLYHLFSTSPDFKASEDLQTTIRPNELKKISFLNSPNTALAIFKIPKPEVIDHTQLIVALDSVRDPGNLGTIIRLCDWFGVKDLVCHHETVDCYNPKVIQATMGSISRVNISYVDLATWILEQDQTTYGAFMNGENIYEAKLPTSGVLVLGNEANGITSAVEKLVSKRISIPQFGELQKTESLNVANATAILLSEFKRR